MIVPVAVASPSVALVGLDSVSVKVSSSSAAESSVVATLTVCEVPPTSNVSVPDAAVKSVPLSAVPPAVAYSTVTCAPVAADSDTVNSTALPSVALASDTLSAGTTTGPATVAARECESGRPSSVQMAPLAWQSVVSGSVIVTSSLPLGSTVTVHARLLLCCWRLAARTAPPVTANAESRSVW